MLLLRTVRELRFYTHEKVLLVLDSHYIYPLSTMSQRRELPSIRWGILSMRPEFLFRSLALH